MIDAVCHHTFAGALSWAGMHFILLVTSEIFSGWCSVSSSGTGEACEGKRHYILRNTESAMSCVGLPVCLLIVPRAPQVWNTYSGQRLRVS